MTKIKLMLDVGVPENIHEEYRKPTIEEKVKRAIDLVDTGYESKVEWEFLRKVNNLIMKKCQEGKASKRAKNILKLIQPVMDKYGEYDPAGVENSSEVKSMIKE